VFIDGNLFTGAGSERDEKEVRPIPILDAC
jgi:hypothetical protein